MQISSRFTIALHILAVIDYLEDSEKVTSTILAGSVGANPVIIRNVMGSLKEAGIIQTSQGKSGIRLKRSLKDVTFYDIYKAIDCVDEKGVFRFHDNPNPECPIGRNINRAVNPKLERIQKCMEDEMKSITVSEVMDDIHKALEAAE